jgi:Nitronate monooxygenase
MLRAVPGTHCHFAAVHADCPESGVQLTRSACPLAARFLPVERTFLDKVLEHLSARASSHGARSKQEAHCGRAKVVGKYAKRDDTTESAMLTTRFTKLVGCQVPIQQAGMGAASPPELVAAVSDAGGLGMLGTARGGLNQATLATLLDRTRELTERPFGVNFIIRPGSVAAQAPREFIEQAAKVGRVVEFFYTDPSAEFVRIVHDHGALASWQVGSPEEASKAADVGCDIIVAQGWRQSAVPAGDS